MIRRKNRSKGGGKKSMHDSVARLLRRAELRAHLVDELLRLCPFNARDIVLIFEQHAKRVGNGQGIERRDVELGERGSPVERLGDAGRLEQILLAQCLHEMHDLLGQNLADARHLGAHDVQFALRDWIADPVIEAAALERVVNFAGAIRRDHHDRRLRRLDRAELGIVTWKSASTSKRNASKASSARSSSSISSTGGPAGSSSSACSSGRLIRKRSENTSCSSRSRSWAPSASATRIAIICAA